MDFPTLKQSRNSLPSLNAPPKIIPNDNWLQPRQNVEAKSYNQHWLYQVRFFFILYSAKMKK